MQAPEEENKKEEGETKVIPKVDYEWSCKKYVCTIDDLDKYLDDNLTRSFQRLFYRFSKDDGTKTPLDKAWRMFYGEIDPKKFFSKFGIDFDHPTVRAAVAVDLIKLDSSDVSNDSTYSFYEHLGYSQFEYERMILNRNFRVNQVKMEKEWSKIKYQDSETQIIKRTVERQYQGLRISEQLLKYFSEVIGEFYSDDGQYKNDASIDSVYMPMSNEQDITTEIAIIPNTQEPLTSTIFRSYYDEKYREYQNLLKKYNIQAVSSFALVDKENGKNHIGKYLVKIQRKFNGQESSYGYVVATIDMNGGIVDNVSVFKSSENKILCLCENDYLPPDEAKSYPDGQWETQIVEEVPMEHSTTSSHYSVFNQRIPDYELKYVRNYLQFSTRLAGMELSLKQMNNDIELKKVHCSECFINQTFTLSKLFKKLSDLRGQVDLLVQICDLMNKYDAFCIRKTQLEEIVKERSTTLDDLIEEYNRYTNDQLDQKIELGGKIKSMKLEIGQNYKNVIESLEEKITSTKDEIKKLYEEAKNLKHNWKVSNSQDTWAQFIEGVKSEVSSGRNDELETQISKTNKKFEDILNTIEANEYLLESSSSILSQIKQITQRQVTTGNQTQDDNNTTDSDDISNLNLGSIIDIDELTKLIRDTERQRDYILALSYELQYLQEMYTKAEDATTKVRRLLHNFEERIKTTEKQVWNKKHTFKVGFSFTDISLASIQDIILLYDWYACNAAKQTYSDLGFTNEDAFLNFRMNCNKVSFNLRKKQYRGLLSIKKQMLEDSLNEIIEHHGNKNLLEYQDKYGSEAEVDEGEEKWDINKASTKISSSARTFAQKCSQAYSELGVLEVDQAKMKERTIDYLKSTGLIETESDLEKYAIRSAAKAYEGDIVIELNKLKQAKERLDQVKQTFEKQRSAIKSIIDSVTNAELKINELKTANNKLFNQCVMEKNKLVRNKLLITKLENENKIVELQGIVTNAKKNHLEDFSSTQKMKNQVDLEQKKYDACVEQFKKNIGLNSETINNLIVGIYNKFQNDILSNEVN